MHKECVEKQQNRQLKAELPSVYVNTVEPGQKRAKPIILQYQHMGEVGGKLDLPRKNNDKLSKKAREMWHK